MKKHLFLVALAGVALAGCVKNEVESPVRKDVKIGFATPVLNSNVDTKASVYGEIGSPCLQMTSGVVCTLVSFLRNVY